MQALLPPPGAADAEPDLRGHAGDAPGSLDEVLAALFRGEIIECLVCGESVEVSGGRVECGCCGTLVEPAPGVIEGQLELL